MIAIVLFSYAEKTLILVIAIVLLVYGLMQFHIRTRHRDHQKNQY
ncbi:hypothetical protein [Dongshaea marina]|nr:hypothetical protein [Dongshaea marina]